MNISDQIRLDQALADAGGEAVDDRGLHAPEWTDAAITALVAECDSTGRYIGPMDLQSLIGLYREDRSRLLSALRSLRERVRQPWQADANGVPYCRYCGQRHPEGRTP